MRKTLEQRRQERFSRYRKAHRNSTQRHWDQHQQRAQHIWVRARMLHTTLTLPATTAGELGCEKHCLLRLSAATLHHMEEHLVQIQRDHD